MLHIGSGRYAEAAVAAQQATSNAVEPWISTWALPDLIEAAVRAGDVNLAYDALERLTESTQPSGTDWALGIEARSRALLSDGAVADKLYQEAIERLSRTQLRPEHSDASGKVADLKAKMAQRRRERDADAATTDADRAESEAEAAIDLASWAADNARLAVLDALDARGYADDLTKAAAEHR